MSSSDTFKLELTIQNLQENRLHLYTNNEALGLIPDKSREDLAIILKKFEIEKLSDTNDLKNLVLKLFNDRLTSTKLYLNENKEQSLCLRFEDKDLVFKKRNSLVTCPLMIEACLTHRNEISTGDNEQELYSLAMIIKKSKSFDYLAGCMFSIEINEKLRNKILNARRCLLQVRIFKIYLTCFIYHNLLLRNSNILLIKLKF